MGFWDILTGSAASDAANKAAADTYAKQQAAAEGAKSYAATVPGQYNQVAGAYAPYTGAGNDALQQLLAGLGLGGDQAAFTRAYQGLPGYQSGLATGQQAAERAINAGGGGLNSGAALKQLYRYGSDYENQRAGDYLTRLGGVAGQGLAATGGQVGTQAQGLGQANQLYGQGLGYQYGSAPTIGQGQVAGAQAEQQALGNLLNVAGYLGGSFLGGNRGNTGSSGSQLSWGYPSIPSWFR